jgi:SulP family sulfate permease
MSDGAGLPLFRGLAGYRREWLRNDISAGLSIAAVGLPSAIAYPAIAGCLPKQAFSPASLQRSPMQCSAPPAG